MQVQIAFRHMESSEALKDYIHKKLEKFDRFAEFLLDVAVTLTQEKQRAVVEFVAAVKGDTLKCKEESEDMYASVDKGAATLERMIKRHREHVRDH